MIIYCICISYIYIYIGSIRFLFGLQILLPTTIPTDFSNGKSLPIIAPRTFGGAFDGRISAVSGGFVSADEFLNRPSDDEVSDHKSESDQEGNFMAFIATAVASEIEIADEKPSDGELSKNEDLQEAYNKLCKIAAKDAMSVKSGLKKINTLKQEKKILLLKLFDANELLNFVKIENMSLLEKVKSL